MTLKCLLKSFPRLGVDKLMYHLEGNIRQKVVATSKKKKNDFGEIPSLFGCCFSAGFGSQGINISDRR